MIKTVVIGPTEHTRFCLEEILRTEGYKVEAVFGSDTSWKTRKARWATFDDLANAHNFELIYCKKLKDKTNVELIKKINPDIIFEFGASEIIPKEILSVPKLGCIGSHGAPLPDFKGGSSLNWALIRDEKEWGVSLYHLAERVDEGDIIDVRRFRVDDRDNIKTMHDKSDYYTVEMLKHVLYDLKTKGTTARTSQTKDGIFLPQRKPEDGKIDWGSSPREIFNLVRALTHPFPGSFSYLDRNKIYIWEANYTENIYHLTDVDNGTCIDNIPGEGMLIKCNNGAVIVQRIGKENGIEMWGDEFYEIYKIQKGAEFGKGN